MHDHAGVTSTEGRLARRREAQRGAHREDVARGGDTFTPGLLGGHVLGCADHDLGGGQTRRRPAHGGDPEVGEVGTTRRVEQHVRRLDVAVHDAGAVGDGQRAEQLVAEEGNGGRGHRSARADVVGQRAARQVGHHEHEVVAVVDHVEQRDDVGVVERLEHLGFAADALAGLVHLDVAAAQSESLQRDGSAGRIDGQIDHAHAAATQSLHERVGHGRQVMRARAAAIGGGRRWRHGCDRDRPDPWLNTQITGMKPSCHTPSLQLRQQEPKVRARTTIDDRLKTR